MMPVGKKPCPRHTDRASCIESELDCISIFDKIQESVNLIPMASSKFNEYGDLLTGCQPRGDVRALHAVDNRMTVRGHE